MLDVSGQQVLTHHEVPGLPGCRGQDSGVQKGGKGIGQVCLERG